MKEPTLTDSNFAKDPFRGGNKKVVTQCNAIWKKKNCSSSKGTANDIQGLPRRRTSD